MIVYLILVLLGTFIWCSIGMFRALLILIDHAEIELIYDANPIKGSNRFTKLFLIIFGWPSVEITVDMESEELWQRVKNGYPGAIPAGTRVKKCNSTETARYPDGTKGVVVGSYGSDDTFYYVIKWDDSSPDDGGIIVEPHRICKDE